MGQSSKTICGLCKKIMALEMNLARFLGKMPTTKPRIKALTFIIENQFGSSVNIRIFIKWELYFSIERIHKWRPGNYSFVFVLMFLTRLTLKQKSFRILFLRTRLVRLISIKARMVYLGTAITKGKHRFPFVHRS